MEIITDELIQLDINLKNKEAVIDHVANVLLHRGLIEDKSRLIEDIYLREEEASTSMGMGIAIPHAKSKAVKQASVVFLRLANQIDWNTDSDVQMVFGIFVPEENIDNEHLKILSSLARKLANEDFRQTLLQVKSKEECSNLLSAINKDYGS